jgi:hypothetical protein
MAAEISPLRAEIPEKREESLPACVTAQRIQSLACCRAHGQCVATVTPPGVQRESVNSGADRRRPCPLRTALVHREPSDLQCPPSSGAAVLLWHHVQLWVPPALATERGVVALALRIVLALRSVAVPVRSTASSSGGGRGEAIRTIYYSDRKLPPGHDPGADSGEAPNGRQRGSRPLDILVEFRGHLRSRREVRTRHDVSAIVTLSATVKARTPPDGRTGGPKPDGHGRHGGRGEAEGGCRCRGHGGHGAHGGPRPPPAPGA